MRFLEYDIDTYTVCLVLFLCDLYDDERICSRRLEFGSFLLTSDMCVFMNYM